MGDEGHNESNWHGDPDGLTGAAENRTTLEDETWAFGIHDLDYLEIVSFSGPLLLLMSH